MILLARLLPFESNAGLGSGSYAPVTRPPSVPGVSSVYVWSDDVEFELVT
jgi:hypothetical protein